VGRDRRRRLVLDCDRSGGYRLNECREATKEFRASPLEGAYPQRERAKSSEPPRAGGARG